MFEESWDPSVRPAGVQFRPHEKSSLAVGQHQVFLFVKERKRVGATEIVLQLETILIIRHLQHVVWQGFVGEEATSEIEIC